MSQMTIRKIAEQEPAIAISETYEPCFAMREWEDKCYRRNIAGAIIVTKVLSDELIDRLTNKDDAWHYNNTPTIVHLTVTGWGGSPMEPGVPDIDKISIQLSKLLEAGYPEERIVIRIDPIIPSPLGLINLERVIDRFSLIKRMRVSVMDCYPHVRDRLMNSEYKDVLNSYQYQFNTNNQEMIKLINNLLASHTTKLFECCAEPIINVQNCIKLGCISELDVNIMVNYDGAISKYYKQKVNLLKSLDVTPKGTRKYCLCMHKVQLIPGGMSRGRCPNKCLYCYLKDS